MLKHTTLSTKRNYSGAVSSGPLKRQTKPSHIELFTDLPFLDLAPILSFDGHVIVVAVSSMIYERHTIARQFTTQLQLCRELKDNLTSSNLLEKLLASLATSLHSS